MRQNPIKRSEHIQKLSREHHFSLLFCWKIRQGLKKKIDLERICKYVQYFWNEHLKFHFREEEQVLFSMQEGRLVQKAIREHRHIRAQVKEIENFSDKNVDQRLEELADTVDNHVRYEERQLFPHLERKLSLDQLEAIGMQLKKLNHSPLQDQYIDEFWNNK
jgi:hemerythrin-like domain-containing protein